MATEGDSGRWEIVDEEGSWAMGADDDTEEGKPHPGSSVDPDSVERSRKYEAGEERNVRKAEETRYGQRRTMFDVDVVRPVPPGRTPQREDPTDAPPEAGGRDREEP